MDILPGLFRVVTYFGCCKRGPNYRYDMSSESKFTNNSLMLRLNAPARCLTTDCLSLDPLASGTICDLIIELIHARPGIPAGRTDTRQEEAQEPISQPARNN